jgi:oxygen-independent coproporphyrinogen-3 oxidase
MFGIPGQTRETWNNTLTEIFAMGSEHLSCYELIYEEDTALFEQLRAGQLEIDEDLNCALYEELLDRAGPAGFEQYEVANFARRTEERESNPCRSGKFFDEQVPARACLHNVNYWRGGCFYGLGPSATSYVRGIRTKNWSNTTLYCQQIEKRMSAGESTEELVPAARAGETAAFGLRMVAGWPFEEFHQVTGQDLRSDWAPEMEELVRKGWGALRSDRFQLTKQGLRFADAAAQLFLR